MVLFGGPSPEHDVSILTGLQAARALTTAGTAVEAIYWTKTGDFVAVEPTLEAKDFLEGAPAKARPLRFVAGVGGGFVQGKSGPLGKEKPLEISAVVNCCHGGPGEDGTLQAALDLAGIAYTGPSAAGAALGMDKLAFAGVVAAAGLPTLPRAVLTADTKSVPFDGPYIVKPRFGGSSIGIEIVEDVDTARSLARSSVHLRQGAIVEPYRPGTVDVNVSVRSHPTLQLSAIEKPLRAKSGSEILGYADKYLGGEGMVSAPRELPAQLAPEVEARVRELATAVAELTNLRGVARIDFLHEGDELLVNEINTIPGSLSTYLWAASDPAVPIAQLLRDMLAEATSKRTTHWTAQGADGTALRSAGSIAGKLG